MAWKKVWINPRLYNVNSNILKLNIIKPYDLYIVKKLINYYSWTSTMVENIFLSSLPTPKVRCEKVLKKVMS
jgi:hypothetical protein